MATVQPQYVNKMPYTSLKKQIKSYAFLGSQILKEQGKLIVFHEFLNCHICTHYLLTVFPTHFLNRLSPLVTMKMSIITVIECWEDNYICPIHQSKKEEKNRLICLRLFQKCNLILLRQTHFN